VAGQAVLIAAEGLLSLSALADLPPRDGLGWAVLAIGATLLALGAVVVFRGISDLGSNLTALPAPVRGARLVETGVYRRVRHPIYAGVVLMGLGWALFAGSLASLAAAILLAGWFDLKSRREEVWLVAHHPGYAAYRQRTARFVPGLY
jgi:protein-S-isoprenylcysteine O-methyltransferase Ste14